MKSNAELDSRIRQIEENLRDLEETKRNETFVLKKELKEAEDYNQSIQ